LLLNFGASGNVTLTVAPLPRDAFYLFLPPWQSKIRLEIAKPKPIPWAFVLNNG